MFCFLCFLIHSNAAAGIAVAGSTLARQGIILILDLEYEPTHTHIYIQYTAYPITRTFCVRRLQATTPSVFSIPLDFLNLTVPPTRVTRAEDIATYREAILSLEQDQYWSKAIDILDEAASLLCSELVDWNFLKSRRGPWTTDVITFKRYD